MALHEEPLLAVEVDRAAAQVVTAAADRALVVSGLNLGHAGDVLQPSHRVTLEHAGVETLSLRGDQAIWASGGWDRRVRVFEWRAPHRPLAVLRHHGAGITAVAWSPNSTRLASASKDGNIAIWSLFPPL